MTITIWTWDWVPEMPRGHVRDLRLRWAAEEAGIAYRIATVPFGAARGPAHLARQPFGQVPFLDDADLRLFESGACLLHLAERGPGLMPADPQGRAEVLQWLFAALSSVEMVTVPWWFQGVSGAERDALAGWMRQRFDALEPVLAGRDWLAGSGFSAADIAMSDVLRVPAALGALAEHPALSAYVDRACDRPAFRRAHAAQCAFYAEADARRAAP